MTILDTTPPTPSMTLLGEPCPSLRELPEAASCFSSGLSTALLSRTYLRTTLFRMHLEATYALMPFFPAGRLGVLWRQQAGGWRNRGLADGSRAGVDQRDGSVWYGMVNRAADKQAKLGTTYSHAQI